MLSLDRFKNIIRDSCLIAIDLIVRNSDAKILIGLRKNAPARGFWFVPGGRIYKNETVSEALYRISYAELGISLKISEVKFCGISDHIHSENFFDDPSFNTHYLLLVYEFVDHEGRVQLENVAQHSEMRFEEKAKLLQNEKVHPLTKQYFLNTPPSTFYPYGL